MPSSLSNRLLTGPSHPGWHGYQMPELGTFCAACDGRLVTPARAHLLVQNAAAHGKKQGEDVDPASDACAEGGTGRPHRREGMLEALLFATGAAKLADLNCEGSATEPTIPRPCPCLRPRLRWRWPANFRATAQSEKLLIPIDSVLALAKNTTLIARAARWKCSRWKCSA